MPKKVEYIGQKNQVRLVGEHTGRTMPGRRLAEGERMKATRLSEEFTLDDFRAERTASLQQLRSLNDPDWSSTHQHPLGPTTATFMLANWVAHDLHHIRQIVGWRYHNLDQATDGLPLVYAGEW